LNALPPWPAAPAISRKDFRHILADRADLSYLITPEDGMELKRWRAQLSAALERYAKTPAGQIT
jgi:hypothetical protein